jgi:hypothetical protein
MVLLPASMSPDSCIFFVAKAIIAKAMLLLVLLRILACLMSGGKRT